MTTGSPSPDLIRVDSQNVEIAMIEGFLFVCLICSHFNGLQGNHHRCAL